MVQGFRIETLDRSGRWYLTPGTRSIYDLRIRNDSHAATDCTLVVQDPPDGVSAEPRSFTLRGYEVRTVTISFAGDVRPARSGRVFFSLRDVSGGELASFEHPLVITGGSDCSLDLSFKDIISESGEIRGFALQCAIRSQSEAPATFQVSLAPHPALSVAALSPLQLQPGESGDLTIPIHWDRTQKDSRGFNHPALLEVSVPVSNGRRATRMRWEIIESNIAKAANGAAVLQASPAAPAAAVHAPQGMRAAGTPTLLESASALMAATRGEAAVKCLPNPNGAATNGASVAAPVELVQPAPVTSPKLTPYAPAKWDCAQQAPASLSAAASKAPAESATHTMRARPALVKYQDPERARGVLFIAGLSSAAIILTLVLFNPFHRSAGPSLPQAVGAVTPMPVNGVAPAVAPALRVARAKTASRSRPKPRRAVAQATPSGVSSASATASPSTPAPAPTAAPAARPPSARVVARTASHRIAPSVRANQVRRQQLYQPESGPVVALGEVAAYYGPRGHVVRVYWSSNEQVRANVSLIDDGGSTVSSTTVRGSRTSALLYLPRRFHGTLTVQVSSIGRMGERVAQTTSLPSY